MTNATDIELTEATKAVFLAYVADAANWSGTPLVGGNVGGTAAERGNLTDLKKKGLIITFLDDPKDKSSVWLEFTDAGKELAASFGFVWNGFGFDRPKPAPVKSVFPANTDEETREAIELNDGPAPVNVGSVREVARALADGAPSVVLPYDRTLLDDDRDALVEAKLVDQGIPGADLFAREAIAVMRGVDVELAQRALDGDALALLQLLREAQAKVANDVLNAIERY